MSHLNAFHFHSCRLSEQFTRTVAVHDGNATREPSRERNENENKRSMNVNNDDDVFLRSQDEHRLIGTLLDDAHHDEIRLK